MPPETRYAKSPGGLIAYQVLGDGPIDLLWLSGGTSHVDVRWEAPASARFFERLASFSRLILFDRRGTGASDPIPVDAPPTWEEWADDLRVVLDATGSEKAAIFAMLDGGPMALIFAATHPDRTTALILANTAVKTLASEDFPIGVSPEAWEQWIDVFEKGWGTEEFAAMIAPSLTYDPATRTWFAKYMRASSSPRAFAAQARAMSAIDARAALPLIHVPTLVLHRQAFPLIPLEHGRYLAQNIAGARLVELEGSDSFVTYGPDAALVLDTIEEFLTGARRVTDPDRVLATILFSDLVDSTQRAAELGDTRWREVLDRHDTLAQKEIEAHKGRMLKTMGDGVLATFDSPGRAIKCALALRESIQGLGIPMRAGLHSGEMELRGDDIGGIAVNIAARVSAIAGPGQVFVSRTVADLVSGSGIRFADRGVHSLKGVPGDWQLLEVEK